MDTTGKDTVFQSRQGFNRRGCFKKKMPTDKARAQVHNCCRKIEKFSCVERQGWEKNPHWFSEIQNLSS